LWKWEQQNGDIRRAAFIPFYRRHEAAYAVACALHGHRDGASLTGINGAIAARQQARDIEAGATEVDLSTFAAKFGGPLGPHWPGRARSRGRGRARSRQRLSQPRRGRPSEPSIEGVARRAARVC
jgi:hypothetical protein